MGWNNPPVDLLVLSACETAVGNADAELGFAGIAFKSGVKSVLASLWQVEDGGALAVMAEFYAQLNQTPIKAEALRRAQVAMIRGDVTLQDGQLRWSGGTEVLPPGIPNSNLPHPYYWSAFTIVGNPW
jgi:CHAT domain-containing protein